jgi:Uma2 family endonuclease
MSTLVKLGPSDHGRPMTYEEYLAGDYQGGYHYELIDGKLYVTPLPNLPENRVELWLFRKWDRYSEKHPAIINYITNKSRVFVHSRPDVTTPEPDLAAYHDFPVNLALEEVRWQEVSPLLVAEVLTSDDPAKDMVRNVELFWEVPSIKEYWIIDIRENPNRPTMYVYRRGRKKWQIIEVASGETYTTKLLPGFKLVLDPRR